MAVGYTLDELNNQITGNTSACFEPSIDYVVCKVPRFNFDKFPGADEELSTQMKAVGEVMSIGRNFPEALNKAWQSMEVGRDGLGQMVTTKSIEKLSESVWLSHTGIVVYRFATRLN